MTDKKKSMLPLSQSENCCPFCGGRTWLCGLITRYQEFVLVSDTTPIVDWWPTASTRLGSVDVCVTCGAVAS